MSDTDTKDDAVMDEWAEAMEDQDDLVDSIEETSMESSAPTATPAEFQTLTEDQTVGGIDGANINLDMILDVPITVSLELGRTRINVRQLLQLSQGSVVQLSRLVDEPMDVLVNGTLIAQGEVVVVNDKFGIRLTDVVSPAERIKQLK